MMTLGVCNTWGFSEHSSAGMTNGRGPVTNVVVVDDHRGLSSEIHEVLGSEPGLRLVGRAENGEEAIALVEGTGPDVAVVCVRSSDLSGMGIGIALRTLFPELRVLAVLTSTGDDERRLLPDLAAHAVVFQTAGPAAVIEGLGVVADGGTFLDPLGENPDTSPKLMGEPAEVDRP
jgi:two-component system response regulator DevR